MADVLPGAGTIGSIDSIGEAARAAGPVPVIEGDAGAAAGDAVPDGAAGEGWAVVGWAVVGWAVAGWGGVCGRGVPGAGTGREFSNTPMRCVSRAIWVCRVSTADRRACICAEGSVPSSGSDVKSSPSGDGAVSWAAPQ